MTLLAALAALLLAPRHADAQKKRPDRLPIGDILKAQSCYNSLDYRCVVDILAPLPDWYDPLRVGLRPEGLSPPDVALALEAGRILALSHLALGANARARLVFLWMLRVDPLYQLAGSEVAPNSFRVFFEVRAAILGPRLAFDVAARAAANPLTAHLRQRAQRTARRIFDLQQPAQPPPPLRLDLLPRAGLRYVALLGRDADTYDDALGVDLGLDLHLPASPWVFGATVAWASHSVRLQDLLLPEQDNLQTLQVFARGGLQLRYGPLALRPYVGLGPTAFGLDQLFSNVALTGLAGLNTSLLLLQDRLILSLEADARPLLVFSSQGPLVSLTLVSGISLSTSF